MGLCLSLHPQPQPPQRSGGGDAVSALDDDNDCSPPPPASSSAVSFSSPPSLKLRLRLKCCWRNISSCRNNILNNKAKKEKKKTKRAKKKKLGRANIEAAEEEEQVDQLHRIPGRMFVNGASEVACLFTQQGRKGTNQDAMLVWENFSSKKDTIFCGIFDGHGPYGHVIAKRVRDSLPLKLCAQWKDTSSGDQNSGLVGSMDSDEATSMIVDDDLCHSDAYNNKNIPEMYLPLKKSLLKAFKLMDKELKLHPTIDCFCSGSTAVALVKQGHDLVIGNVGDSRAVLGTRDKDNSMVALQLTVDLKPNLPKEAARIQQFKGRVFALQDEPEVARVWLPNSDSPGLAMARAFGDFCLKDFGLISVPDVSYHCLTERDEFIVLATDGVWDVLSNDEVVDIVASAPSRTTAARAIVDCAVRAWKLKFPTSKSDDCAVVCLFLDHPCSTNQALETTSDQRIVDADPIISPMAVEHQMDNEPILSSDTSCHGTDGPVLQNVFSLGDSDEIVPVCESIEEKHPGRCQSTRSLAECISTAEDEEWSALEGVTRVNSLLNLPRFLPGDKRAASWIRWF